MLLPMGMQAQSASHPPPPPLPPPPSCSTQPRSRGARRPVASAVQRGAPDKRGLGFYQQSQRPTERRRWQQQRASERAQLNQTLEHPHVPAAHREGYRTGMLLRSYTIYQKSGKLEIILDSMAWKRAIRANAQRHTSTSHKRSLSLAHTPRQT